jgi:hypothetical protein
VDSSRAPLRPSAFATCSLSQKLVEGPDAEDPSPFPPVRFVCARCVMLREAGLVAFPTGSSPGAGASVKFAARSMVSSWKTARRRFSSLGTREVSCSACSDAVKFPYRVA